ncbi:MAG: GNAT family N-acetyltransferase, partial [Luminiphilus sp.]
MIRDALPGDWPAIWPIFEEIVRAGNTYAFPADTDEPTAEALWMTKPDRTFVFEHDGKILGTYYLKT